MTNNMEITPGFGATRHLAARAAAPLLTVTLAVGSLLAAVSFAQSAKEIRGATPYAAIENEPAPKLIVDPPVPDLLAQGRRLDPVAGRERAHRTGVREGRPQRISTGRASAHKCGRPALVVGGREWYQHGRPSRDAARPPQG